MACKKNGKLCNSDDCIQCFDRSFASNKGSIYWSDENIEQPRNVSKYSRTKYIFDCKCGHRFIMALRNITEQSSWCQYCRNQKLCDDDDCESCYNKSFASHPRAKYWSTENDIEPRSVFKGTNKQYKFDCKCGHTFQTSLNLITGSQNSWCSYCSNLNLCDNNDCQTCYDKSFASHIKAIYWSTKNKYTPRQVFKHSNNRYKFDCECGHEFESMLKTIANNSWCSYCSNPPLNLCENESCQSCYDKSFASHPRAKYFSNKNDFDPRYIFCSSPIYCIFECEYGHEFESRLDGVTGKRKKWCPNCRKKTEAKLLKWLEKYYDVTPHAKYDWCMRKRYLPFDFAIEKYKIIIELDGEQHFKKVSTWKGPEETQKTDRYKMKCAIENNYTIIRLLQNDVWNDKYNWKKKLLQLIQSYDEPECIFVSKGTEYKCFEENI